MAYVQSVESDIAVVKAMIAGPDSALAEYLAVRPYLRSPDDARHDLAGLLVGLEDARAGRVVSHDRVLADVEERRQGYRVRAAE